MDQDSDALAALSSEIDLARRDYRAGRERLETVLGQSYLQPGSAADSLASTAEEYGREHAVELLTTRQRDFGDQDSQLSMSAIEQSDELLKRLEAAHDRLDELTARREAITRSTGAQGRLINIHAEEYVVDHQRRMRALREDPEQELTLTQKKARELGIAPAGEDRSVPPRRPSRSR